MNQLYLFLLPTYFLRSLPLPLCVYSPADFFVEKELLLVVWGVCFIMKIQDRAPVLKGRRFKIPSKKKGNTRRTRMSTGRRVSGDSGEERPQWEADVEVGESQYESAATTAPPPVGASERTTNQDDSRSTRDCSSDPKIGQSPGDITLGTDNNNNSSSVADAPTTEFGQSSRPAFCQHVSKGGGSLDDSVSIVNNAVPQLSGTEFPLI